MLVAVRIPLPGSNRLCSSSHHSSRFAAHTSASPRLGVVSRGRTATRVEASATRPLLQVAVRVVARTLPATWAATARSLGGLGSRASPLLLMFLLGYIIISSARSQVCSSSSNSLAIGNTSESGSDPSAAAAKDDGRVVCKVCGGSGQVSLENHMAAYDGTICPCCLGKGRVRKAMNSLIGALLSFDP